MKTQNIICETCGITFAKANREVNRSIKLDRKQYCSISCSSKDTINLDHLNKIRPKNSSQLIPSNRSDAFTGFREHIRRIKKRTKEIDVDLQDLKEVFDLQKGICNYSGVLLAKVPKKGKSNPIYTMSLGRIDSNLGYTKSNIQFISIAMNHLKNSMSHEEMLEVLKILKG